MRRKAAMDFLKPKQESIPEELKGYNQWVVWKAKPRDGKTTKVPYDPKSGKEARTNEASTWAAFDKAWQMYQSGGYTGIGFVLTDKDPFCGVDLDHCRDPKTEIIEDWATNIVQELKGYTELSPSGAGLRIFVKAELPPGPRKKGNFEVYDTKRYLTITGRTI